MSNIMSSLFIGAMIANLLITTAFASDPITFENAEHHLRECRLGWKLLREQEEIPTGSTFQQKKNTDSSNESTMRDLYVYAQSGNLSIERGGALYCKNELYSFELTKKTDVSPWALERMTLGFNDATIDRRIIMPNEETGPSFRPLTFTPIDVTLMMENDFLTFGKCNYLPNGNLSVTASGLIPLPKQPQEILDKALVFLKKNKGKIPEAEYAEAEKRILGKINTLTVNALMELDTKREYLIVQGTFSVSTLPSRIYHFERSVKGKPTLKSFESLRVNITNTGAALDEKSKSYQFTRTGDYSKHQGFWLTDYNMPEPPGITPPPRTGYMMYLYIAIPVFAAVGLFFAYIRRRYFPRAVALPPTGTAGS